MFCLANLFFRLGARSEAYKDTRTPQQRQIKINWNDKMDIDLFLSPYGECGLLCNEEFQELPAGMIFDAETLELTFEFINDSPFHLNITAEDILKDPILMARKLYVGFLRDGLIADTIEVPMLYLNDPYGGDFNANDKLSAPRQSMIAFEQFMKRCTTAQPIHRDDLGNEDSSGSVLNGMDPKQLEFVPQLIRQRLMEMTPQAPGMAAAPQTPTAPGFSGMRGPGGMGGNTSAPRRQTPPRRPPPRDDDDQ